MLHTLRYIISCSLSYKFECTGDKFSSPVVLQRGKIEVYRFIKAILEEYYYCKNVIKNVLIKILSYLQKMEKGFNQVISAGYVIKYLMYETIK